MRLASSLLLALTLAAGCFGGDDDGMVGAQGGVGDRCSSATDCRVGLQCDSTATCQPSGTGTVGALCQLTADCAEGLYCGPQRECRMAGDGAAGAGCATTGDCQAGLRCVIGGLTARCTENGTGDLGDACGDDSACYAGLSCQLGPSETRVCSSPAAAPMGAADPPSVPIWGGEVCMEIPGVPRAVLEVPRDGAGLVDFYRMPFPTDARRVGERIDLGGHPSSSDALSRYIDASGQDLNGFGLNPTMFFRFSIPHDWGTVSPESIRIVNVDADSESYQQIQNVSWLSTFGGISRYICPNWLAMRPPHGSPLEPGTTYAAIVTDAVAPDGGGLYETSPDLDALLAGTAPADTALTRAWEAYAPLRQYLADTDDLTTADVLNATVFTTQDDTRLPGALRAAVREAGAPAAADLTACDDAATSPCDDGTEARACAAGDGYVEVHGRLSLPVFMGGSAPYLDEGGGITVSSSTGRPQVDHMESVCFAMALPEGDPPAGGFPVVIASPGTGGSFTSLVRGFGRDMAAQGVAIVSIELPQHGARRGGSDIGPEFLVYNFDNPRAARDVWLQGAADLYAAVSWVETFDMAAGSSPTGSGIDFDELSVGMLAHSQGANHAALMVAEEPGLRAVVLSGIGGDLTLSMQHKRSPVDIAAVVPYALADADAEGRLAVGSFHPVLAIFQAFFDRVDPVNHARRLYRDPPGAGLHVMATWGLGDTFAPDRTVQSYAVAARLPLVTPVLTRKSDGAVETFGLPTVDPPAMGNLTVADEPRTIGLRQYEPAMGEDGHFVATSGAGRADVIRFLTDALGGDVPRIGN